MPPPKKMLQVATQEGERGERGACAQKLKEVGSY